MMLDIDVMSRIECECVFIAILFKESVPKNIQKATDVADLIRERFGLK
jgi:DNA-binding protein